MGHFCLSLYKYFHESVLHYSTPLNFILASSKLPLGRRRSALATWSAITGEARPRGRVGGRAV